MRLRDILASIPAFMFMALMIILLVLLEVAAGREKQDPENPKHGRLVAVRKDEKQ